LHIATFSGFEGERVKAIRVFEQLFSIKKLHRDIVFIAKSIFLSNNLQCYYYIEFRLLKKSQATPSFNEKGEMDIAWDFVFSTI